MHGPYGHFECGEEEGWEIVKNRYLTPDSQKVDL